MLLVDGVKVIHDDGWALVFPDPEEPLTHVWAEAATRRRRPGPGPGVRPAHPQHAALLSVPRSVAAWRRRGERVQYIPGHERPRRPPLHLGPRVGPPGGRPVRVGITDYAQDALGDVVFVQLPEPGRGVAGGRVVRGGRVDQVGLRRLRALSTGVVEVNAELATRPSSSTRTPTGRAGSA